MLSILFYEHEAEQPTSLTALEDALARIPGLTWSAPAGSAYRPGQWRDPATGARAAWDLGIPPLLQEDAGADDPPRSYSGWRAVPLALSVPLAGPHWQAVTALAQVDRLLQAAPHLMPLDSEDTVEGENAEPGPFPWDRPRAIASWEKQRADRSVGLALPRLGRAASVALWRYRVERAAGRAAFPEHHWPEGLALHDLATGEVRTACLWGDPGEPLALPPVDVVVVRGGAVPADELRLLAGDNAPGGARLITPSAAVGAFHAGAKPLPASRFRGLGDEDWVD